MNLGKDKCMGNIKIDLKNARVFEKNITKYAKQVKEIHNKLHEKSNDKKEFCRLAKFTRKI